jgi:hypothetical protein
LLRVLESVHGSCAAFALPRRSWAVQLKNNHKKSLKTYKIPFSAWKLVGFGRLSLHLSQRVIVFSSVSSSQRRRVSAGRKNSVYEQRRAEATPTGDHVLEKGVFVKDGKEEIFVREIRFEKSTQD